MCKFTILIFLADDSNLFLNGKNLKILKSILNSEFEEIVKWVKNNKLSLNVNNTQHMVLTKKREKEI